MAITFITPVDITPTTTASWVDVDVSSHISASATGVMVAFENVNGLNRARNCYIRKNGSTDSRLGDPVSGVTTYCCGVDGSGLIEAYIENTVDFTVRLIGYFEGDAVFFTNATTYTPLKDVWSDVDISGDTGADTSIAALVNIGESAFVRENGSTDGRSIGDTHNEATAIIGVDASEIFEVRRDTNSYYAALIGYITGGYVSEGVNATDVTPASVDTWTDLTALGSTDAVGGIYEGYPASIVGTVKKGVTPGSEHKSTASYHTWRYSECDSSQIVQGYFETGGGLYLHGYFEAAAATTTTLTVDSGSFLLTGGATDLLTHNILGLVSGSLAVTGQDATLSTVFKLALDSGSVSITGQAADLLLTSLLTADSGSVAVTGQDASLILAILLAAESGSYSLAGQDTQLLLTSPLGVDSGQVTITGQPADLLLHSFLVAASGSLAITGQPVSFTLTSPSFQAGSGSLLVTGQAADLLVHYVLPLDSGSMQITGQNALLIFFTSTPIDSGEFLITGQTATLTAANLASAVESGGFNLVGYNAVLRTILYGSTSWVEEVAVSGAWAEEGAVVGTWGAESGVSGTWADEIAAVNLTNIEN